jgi:hypothetical protein
MNYRIYLKTPEMKKYGAISGGGIAHNLIYAEMWEDQTTALLAFAGLVRINPSDWKWQLRSVDQHIIKQSEA